MYTPNQIDTYMILYTENVAESLDSPFTIKSFVAYTRKEFEIVLRNIEEIFNWTILECVYPHELAPVRVRSRNNRRRR